MEEFTWVILDIGMEIVVFMPNILSRPMTILCTKFENKMPLYNTGTYTHQKQKQKQLCVTYGILTR